MQENRKLTAIGGLKALALLYVYWWHCPLPKPSVSIGGSMCTFLFVASGFLVAYNWLSSPTRITPGACIRYVGRKFLTAWPLHIVLFAVCALMFYREHDWLVVGANVFMLQSWSADPGWFFSYNGVSWFLSSLMFCYAVSLPVVAIVRWRPASFFVLALSVLAHWGLATAVEGQWFPFAVCLHVFPVFRALQFCIGLSACGVVLGFVGDGRKARCCTCALELAALTVFLVITWLIKDINSVVFPLVFSLVLAVFIVEGGVVSRILSVRPIQLLATCQFEFFLIHQVVIRMFSYFFHTWIMDQLAQGHVIVCTSYILFEAFVALGLSVLWHFLFTRRFNVAVGRLFKAR